MSFRRDRILKRRKQRLAVVGVAVGIMVIMMFVVGTKPLVSTGYRVATPFWQLRAQANEQFSQGVDMVFTSKRQLLEKLTELENQRAVDRIALLRADMLERENEQFREALGYVWPDESWLVAGILVKPPHTPYDVLVLDVGSSDGVDHDQLVFSSSGVVLGVVTEVLKKQSFVALLSTPGMKTDVVMESYGIAVTAEGRGGGVYEIHVPRDVPIEEGDQVVLPGRQTEVLGRIGEILFDPRDPFQTAFASAPINFYEQRFVYVSDRTTSDIPEVDTVVLEVDSEGVDVESTNPNEESESNE